MIIGDLSNVQDAMADVLSNINEFLVTSMYSTNDFIKILIPNIYVTKLIGTSLIIRRLQRTRDSGQEQWGSDQDYLG